MHYNSYLLKYTIIEYCAKIQCIVKDLSAAMSVVG
jgi:hypothetical protein